MRSFHRSMLLLAASSIFIMGLVMIFNTTSAEMVDLGASLVAELACRTPVFA